MFELYDARVISRKTYLELARFTGISANRISQIERGLVQPTSNEKKCLANALALRPFEINWEEEDVAA